ncbi:MAG: hypothetical protein ACAI43_10750 [Phycisphaerae bacterium]|nr:hypothetical protein [Tepidisphaeraceae bacterium]
MHRPTPPPTRRTLRDRRSRPGISAVIAMMFLILFGSLALGFYAAVNTSVQVAGNETHARHALLSAESGVEFVRYVLGNVNIPPQTPDDQIWSEVCTQVKAQLDGTANVNNTTLSLPAGETWVLPTVNLPTGGTFQATLQKNGEHVTVTVAGIDPRGVTGRRIRVDFARAQRASRIFDYGVASKSAISMSGKAVITGAANNLSRGSALSATNNPVPLTMTGTPSISGDFSYTNPAGAPAFANGSIAGYKPTESEFLDHVHGGVQEPEFPTIDSKSFEKYVPSATAAPGPQVIATNPSSSRKSFTNIRIKANANPSFAGGSVMTGVIYIETPNKITFTGGVTVQGVIVVQNNPTGDISSNEIKFGGNVLHQGVESLPNTDPFVGLNKLGGTFLLAPKFTVSMHGNSNTVGGTIVTGALDITGTAGATVSGTVINLEDTRVNLTGTSDIVISSTGTTNYPTGVTFGKHFAALPGTYQELP